MILPGRVSCPEKQLRILRKMLVHVEKQIEENLKKKEVLVGEISRIEELTRKR